jgi:MFS transporter, PPP family, 3-phenylpropionic acid transporter
MMANFLLLFITLCFRFINEPVIIIIFMAVMGFAQNPQPGILDSWILKKFEGREGEYGFIRSWASLGFALFALFYGQIIDLVGWNIIFVFSTLFFIASLVVSYFKEDVSKKDFKKAPSVSKDAIFQLIGNSQYRYILLIGFVMNLATSSVFIFLPLIISSVGGTSKHLGAALFTSVIAEVPTFILSKRILLRFRPKTVLMISSSISIILFTLLFFAKTPATIIIVTSIEGFAFGSYLSSVRRFVNRVSPLDLRTTDQTVYDGVCTGLTGVIAGIVSGFLLQNYGVPMLLGMCMTLSITGIIILSSWKAVKDDEKYIADIAV